MLTHGSLFSGIGGFDLGFERAGIKTIWQVEIDEYCRRVLASHWPAVSRYSDIRKCCGIDHFTQDFEWQCRARGREHLRYVDILSGGFPCQDISNAGKRAGIDGERSGLWSEYGRLIRELRPRYVVVENVAALLGRGMERVLGDLAACGYDAEWQSIRASDFGAPHRRERIWIVAYPQCTERRALSEGRNESDGNDARWKEAPSWTSQRGEDVADTIKSGLERYSGNGANRSGRKESERPTSETRIFHSENDAEDSDGIRRRDAARQWGIEPDVGRVAHGVPARVDRLKGLGNAIIPQIAEYIGRQIVNDWRS